MTATGDCAKRSAYKVPLLKVLDEGGFIFN
jgi:hypothetical protein